MTEEPQNTPPTPATRSSVDGDKVTAESTTAATPAGDSDVVDPTQAWRVGLQDYDLTEEDQFLLDASPEAVADTTGEPLPVVAIVGRPNVGKSTLVNRIIGRRAAVVEDVPGVTRDRVSYPAEWTGRQFMLVDTGGWERTVAGLDLAVAQQAEVAASAADVVIMVVDATVGATATDEAVVDMLRRSGTPVVLAANKVDDLTGEADAAVLWNLGLGEPYPVSGVHGRGTGDLLDAVLDKLPQVLTAGTCAPVGGARRIALIGRPNVGKSSLLNRLAGGNRVVVDAIAGTTRDPVDEVIELDGREWVFVDTAGIRRRVNQSHGADYYASLRTATALDRAEVAIVLIDASEPLAEQDVRVVSMAAEAGRAVIIAYNKWDLIDDERRAELERSIERDLVQLQWAPRVNMSAATGWHTGRLVPALDTALASWDARISTSQLNSFLGQLVAAHPHPVRSGKQPRILFGTQASNRPPRFVLFTTGFFEAGYRRFIERRLREEFGFQGSPIQVSVRPRERKRR